MGSKIVAFHRSTFNNQHAHCHPRFTPDREASPGRSEGDGKAVLYTSDLMVYSSMYLVEVGEFDEVGELD